MLSKQPPPPPVRTTTTAFHRQQQQQQPHCRSFHGITRTNNSPTTRLLLGKDSNPNSNHNNNSDVDVDGMQNAPYIFTFILLLCVWNFTIPTEFRRARICSEQQTIDYPLLISNRFAY